MTERFARWAILGSFVLGVASCSNDGSSSDAGSGGSNQSGSSGSAGSGGASATSGSGGSGGTAGSAGAAGSAGSGGASGGSAGASAGGSGGAGSGGTGGLSGELDLYWVDVEGGAATIIKTPSGKVVLVDTGNPGGRDSGRILEVLDQEVAATQLDHVLITHYHTDHVGGASEVADGIDVLEFIDHGDSVEPGSGTDYPALASGRRRSVVAGDSVDLGSVSLTIVQANGVGITEPLGPDTPNPLCVAAESRPKNPDDENSMSVGYLLKFGSFEFVDLGDLTWGYEQDLACPVNLLGEVDLFQIPHHGLEISSAPQLFGALNPLAAVASNGPTKGNEEETFERVMAIPALEHLWVIHRSENNDAAHNPPDAQIANLMSGGSDEAHFIHANVKADGAFTITNSRDGSSQSYQAR